MPKVFISYSHKNKSEAVKLLEALRQKGHEVYLDSVFLRIGANFRMEITKQIKASDGFLVLVTNESRTSDYVLSEIGSAMVFHSEKLLMIIPVVKHPPTPSMISDIHFLSVEDDSFQGNELELIIEKIHIDLSQFVEEKARIIQTKLGAELDNLLLFFAKVHRRYQYMQFIFGGIGSASILILITSLWALFSNNFGRYETATASVGSVAFLCLGASLLLLIKVMTYRNKLDFAELKLRSGDFIGAMNITQSIPLFSIIDIGILVTNENK